MLTDPSSKIETRAEPEPMDHPSDAGVGLAPLVPSTLKMQDRFTIYEPVGAGSFATVYRARDNVLGRIVALKLLHLPLALLPETWQRRFITELRASAALHHPNLVAVFDAGLDEQRCYFVCEFISGRTLAKWIAEQQTPITPVTAADIVAQLADGVQHAHESQILHRDLKPSNILLDEARPHDDLPFTPRVSDFGMAQFREFDATVTIDGTVLGSPAYMSPEQALGLIKQQGPPTDIYSLGVILYQLLTKQTPLSASTTVVQYQTVVTDEASSPKRLRADLPVDLEAICLKCIEKEPSRRYASAVELALDLRRFLAGNPVAARAPGTIERMRRLARRHPAWFSLMTTVIVSVSIVVALLFAHSRTIAAFNRDLTASNDRLVSTNHQLRDALRTSHDAMQRAEIEEQRAVETIYAYDIGRAFEAWKKWDSNELHALVSRYAETASGPNSSFSVSRASLRGPEWYWLSRQFHRDSREITKMPSAVYRQAITPDAKQLVVAGRDDLLRVVELATGQTLHEWPAGQKEVNGLMFSPDGKTLWTCGDSGTVAAWDFSTRTRMFQFQACPAGIHVYEVLHDPLRNLLITCGDEPTIRLWDAQTGDARGVLEGHTKGIDVILLHSDGQRLFSGSKDHTIRVWDMEKRTGDTLNGRMREKVFALALSLDGRLLAAGTASGQMLVWDLGQNAPRVEGLLKDGIDRIRFDASAERVFAIDANGVVWEWPVPLTVREATEPSPPANVWQDTGIKPYDVQLSPDGRELLMARRDGRVHAFQLTTPESDDLTLRFARVRDFECLPDGRIAVAEDRQLIVVDPRNHTRTQQVLDDSGPWSGVAASPDGSLLSAKSTDGGRVGVWRLADGTPLFKRVSTHPEAYHELSFSADGRWLALANSAEGRLEILDSQTGEFSRAIEANSCRHAVFSPNGNVLAFDRAVTPPGIGRELRLIDWPSGKHRAVVPSRSVYTGTEAVSPDGRLFATAADRTIQIYDTASGKLVHHLFGHRGDIKDVHFSPDSSRIVSAGEDACVKLWHVPTGHHLLDFSCSFNRSMTGCQITADGSWLVFSTEEQLIRLVRLK